MSMVSLSPQPDGTHIEPYEKRLYEVVLPHQPLPAEPEVAEVLERDKAVYLSDSHEREQGQFSDRSVEPKDSEATTTLSALAPISQSDGPSEATNVEAATFNTPLNVPTTGSLSDTAREPTSVMVVLRHADGGVRLAGGVVAERYVVEELPPEYREW